MDQATHPARYCACNRDSAPMRRGRLGSLIRRASLRRGLTDYCGSLSRENRSGAGRRLRFLLSGDNPLQGVGGTVGSAQYATALDRTPGPQRRTESASKGGRQAVLSFALRPGHVGWPYERSREAEEAREEGPAEVAEREAQREARQEARQHLYGLGRRVRRNIRCGLGPPCSPRTRHRLRP
jgi:hypothetical protein